MTATLKTSVIKEPSSLVDNIVLGGAGQVGLGGANYGTAGQAIISGGANAAPSWGGVVTSVKETIFEGSGNYTPNANGLFYEVICIGGGASGGQSPSSTTNVTYGNGGPGAGSAVVSFTKSQMGNAAITVTVGAGGAYNNNSGTPLAGGASSFGNYITANGGPASNTNVGTATVNVGTANTTKSGNAAVNTVSENVTRQSGFALRPYSGPTFSNASPTMAGSNASFVGSGGGGGSASGTANISRDVPGGAGGPGIVIVREYL
jgi:hypothetical protein